MDHGGNLQLIALGMQRGTIDPTVGTLAAVLKKHMVADAQTSQAPTQTVAQQLFTPPAPPMGGPPAQMAGLGATPEAAQMMAPPMEQAMAPPPMEQAMGMAEGGMVPPYMNNGGLAELPVPDTMFDEPHDGSYAGGGIVAFAAGTPRGVKEAEAKPKPPENLFGYSSDPMALVEEHRRLYKPKTEASERARQLYGDVLSEEGQKKRRNEDIGSFLMNFGGNLASTTNPGGFLAAAGDSLVATAPMLREASKERRAEQREAIKQLALDEGASNEEARREADLYMQGKGKYAELAQTAQKNKEDREFQLKQFEGQQALGYAQIEATKAAAAAARDKPDFMQNAVATRFRSLKEANARRRLLKPNEEFDPKVHRLSDATLENMAYQQVMGDRYFDPATNPLTQNRAAVIGKVLGPDGGGEQGVTTVAWPSPKS
jgi:hypothetical protein